MTMLSREARTMPRVRPRRLHESRPASAPQPARAPEENHVHSRSTCPCGGGCPACAAKSAGHGQALDQDTRGYFERALGADLRDVRVHADTESARSAKSMHASAYAVGQDIHFGAGRFQPHTNEGRDLLGHELIHVLQQRHLALRGEALMAQPDHALERNAREVAAGSASIARAERPMVLRQGDHDTPPRFRLSPGFGVGGNTPQFNIGGHTIEGDTRAARGLLDAQLTVGATGMPVYLGIAMTLDQVSSMLSQVTPALTSEARSAIVQSVWWDKVSAVRQLPPLFPSAVNVPIASPSTQGSGTPTPSIPSVTRVLPTPSQAASNYTGLPDATPRIGISSLMPGPGASGGGSTWQPSVGSQVVINIGRGLGVPLVQGAGQRQYTMGDNLQVVFQDSTDAASTQYSAVAGGQALGDNMIDSKIVQLQPFVQLLAGLSQMPGDFSATMVVQFSMGVQLTLKFGPITIQLSAGLQVTGQQGQGVQPGFALGATIGPTNPDPSGTQTFGPRNNWSIGVGPPPPLPGVGGLPERHPSGGMLYFGGNLPSWMQL